MRLRSTFAHDIGMRRMSPYEADARTHARATVPISAGILHEEIAPSMSQTIDHKVSVSPLLPGVSVSFNAQSFGGFEVVVYSAGNEPSELYSGLRAVGFTSRHPTAQPDGVRQTFGRYGSALLGGWTGPERERFLAEARRTLRRFGFAFVPEVQYQPKPAP